MTVRIVTPPATEPVTLAEAKTHLRLEETRDDSYVTTLIVAARQYIEKVCWRGLISQSLQLIRPSFRGTDNYEVSADFVAGFPQPLPVEGSRFQPYLELPQGHLAASPNVSVLYLDENGAEQTLSSSAYIVESRPNDNGRLWLNVNGGYSWPNTLDRFDAVKVNYTVGWADASSVPAPIKQALLLLVSQLYEYRSPQVTGTIVASLEFSINALLSPYRLVRI